MTERQKLEWCKSCVNKYFTKKQGLVCGLTGEKPDFERTCPSYQPEARTTKERSNPIIVKPPVSKTPAPMFLRFVNFLVDNVILGLVTRLVFYLMIIAPAGVLVPGDDGSTASINTGIILVGLLVLLVLIVFSIYIGYYVYFEGKYGQTPGKMLTRTMVVTTKRTKPTSKAIFKRTLYRLIPWNPASFLIDGEAKGLHDIYSDTMVYMLEKDVVND